MKHETLEEMAMRGLKSRNSCPECIKCLEIAQSRGYPFGHPSYNVVLAKDGFHYHHNGIKCSNVNRIEDGKKCECEDCIKLENVRSSSLIWNTTLAR